MSRNAGLCIVWSVFWISFFGFAAANKWAKAYQSAPVVCEALK